MLQEHAERQAAERERWGAAWFDRGLVFTREDGDMLLPDSITHLFIGLADRASLPRIHFHDLRHTSASLALAAQVVIYRLGHSSTSITSDLYTPTSCRPWLVTQPIELPASSRAAGSRRESDCLAKVQRAMK